MNQHGPKSAAEQLSNKACDACRMHKIRCLPMNTAGSKICQRCSKTDRQCVWSAPQKRKQRKRTDTRVAELEREVLAMKSLFDRSSSNLSSTPTSVTHPVSNTSSSVMSNPTLKSLSKTENDINFSTPDSNDWSPPPYSSNSDVVDRDILSMEMASQLFHSYKSDLVQHYPAVVISPEITAEELRKTKPTLFLAIIAAAAGKSDPYLYSILNSEVLSAYAHRTLVQGEKSLELVQSMLITSIWYYPPGKYAQLKFYEYIHMAAVMALEIGLGTNPKGSRNRQRLNDASTIGPDSLDSHSLERKRTFLACYMITTGVSMSMRRPNMLRWNDWINECLEVVAHNPEITQFDKWLVAWVRLLAINEEFATAFSWDDSSNMANLSEPRVQIMVGGFEKKLEAWKKNHEPDGINEALLLQYYHSQLYLHELALHDDHFVEDFRPPYDLEKVLSVHLDPKATLSHISSISLSISSAHSLLEALLDMPTPTIRALPIFNFVRMAYSFITLIKLYISSKTPGSHIGAALKPEDMKLDYYLQAMIEKSAEAVRPKEFRAPFTFLGMLIRYQNWLESQKEKKVFVAPKTTIFEDDCWLPKVSHSQWERLDVAGTEAPAPVGRTGVDHRAPPLHSGLGNLDLNQTMAMSNPPLSFEDMADIPLDGLGTNLGQMMGLEEAEFFDWMPVAGLQYDNQVSGYSEWDSHGSGNLGM